MNSHVLWTGLAECFNSDGKDILCKESGQDGEFRAGIPWPQPRFVMHNENIVRDRATDLFWTSDASLYPYPMNWQEGLTAIDEMNREKTFGRDDWRLPNRREMRSLISHGARKPALPPEHPFKNIFLGWYWTSTTAAKAPSYAWYVNLEGGRMFYGRKDSYYLIWPVCGNSTILPRTGQNNCYDDMGVEVPCNHSGQDGELLTGAQWPHPRFKRVKHGILDLLTRLTWHPQAHLEMFPATWDEALIAVQNLTEQSGRTWRLPSINELESLVDASSHSPALPSEHPFTNVQEAYWSSTTSYFETDWAYVLYMHKGAVGVGFKKNRDFAIWPVLESGFPN
jgi:hypothetical protein